ncbi:hypothetical protein LMG28138_05727 [Pararobbsia alpina]|uniref:Uncharacterized protein n=1 Tax=Pararobbsia alpina TaxID=621374 RepID=A0A6S7CC30_9BURK|nr:hypothetical protein LMG28138_05727 [Pararobbsia alpina]
MVKPPSRFLGTEIQLPNGSGISKIMEILATGGNQP